MLTAFFFRKLAVSRGSHQSLIRGVKWARAAAPKNEMKWESAAAGFPDWIICVSLAWAASQYGENSVAKYAITMPQHLK